MNPDDPRFDDPNFLLCLALTYLGIPPGLWRVVVNQFLEATLLEYKQRYGEQRGSREFADFRIAIRAWSAFNLFKLVVVFLAESKIAIIPISNAAAIAIRRRLLVRLAEKGVQEAAILGASQIVRKVAIFVELAWITGCAGYCGEMAVANAITEFSLSALDVLSGTVRGVTDIADGIVTNLIARPILVGRAMLDPSNWDTSPVQSAALAIRLMGNSLWSQVDPSNANNFLTNLSRPISDFGIPRSVIDEIALALTRTVDARGGIQQAVTFTSDLLLGLTPLAFVQLLSDWQLLRFQRDPQAIAREALGR